MFLIRLYTTRRYFFSQLVKLSYRIRLNAKDDRRLCWNVSADMVEQLSNIKKLWSVKVVAVHKISEFFIRFQHPKSITRRSTLLLENKAYWK